jgi:hypothetical protein
MDVLPAMESATPFRMLSQPPGAHYGNCESQTQEAELPQAQLTGIRPHPRTSSLSGTFLLK